MCSRSGTLAHSIFRGPICKCVDNFNIILHEECVRIWVWFEGFIKPGGVYSLVEQLSDSQKKKGGGGFAS